MVSAARFLLVGSLTLATGLMAPFMLRMPVTTAIAYLAVGIVVGPTVLKLFHFNPLQESAAFEAMTEAAVLIALFAAGLKMPAPVTWSRWRTPMLLASLSMAITSTGSLGAWRSISSLDADRGDAVRSWFMASVPGP